ncbi:hypothetical protein U1Q18_020893 [Sarracenia purpurea var. burkii]
MSELILFDFSGDLGKLVQRREIQEETKVISHEGVRQGFLFWKANYPVNHAWQNFFILIGSNLNRIGCKPAPASEVGLYSTIAQAKIESLVGHFSRTRMARRLPTQLFVSRLSFYTTEEELKRLFSPFGLVTEARLAMNPKTQRPKGFGFVTYESEVEAHSALKAMNGRIVNGRLIFVEVAKSERQGGEEGSS